jgi:sec-independent protein translocase protein TatA
MGSISPAHLILLIIILLIFFGPSRLPQLGQSLGKAIRGFKEGLNEVNADAKDVGPQQQIKPADQAQATTSTNVQTETKKENS